MAELRKIPLRFLKSVFSLPCSYLTNQNVINGWSKNVLRRWKTFRKRKEPMKRTDEKEPMGINCIKVTEISAQRTALEYSCFCHYWFCLLHLLTFKRPSYLQTKNWTAALPTFLEKFYMASWQHKYQEFLGKPMNSSHLIEIQKETDSAFTVQKALRQIRRKHQLTERPSSKKPFSL